MKNYRHNFQIKQVYLHLLIAILLNVIFRYPFRVHSKGTDSFGNLGVAQYISEQGFHSIFQHPFSFFGLYPHSYNMGGSFLLAGFSSLSGLSVELSVLFLNFGLVTISVLGMYLFSYGIYKDKFFAIVAVLLMTLSRKMYYFTEWTYSYRGPFLCLLPVFFFLLMNSRRSVMYRYFIITIILFIGMISFHRLGYFFLFVIPFLILATLFYSSLGFNMKRRIMQFTEQQKLAIGMFLTILFLCLISFSPQFSFYESGVYNKGEVVPSFLRESFSFLGPFIEVIVFSFGYSMITGLFFPFTFLGIIILFSNPFKSIQVFRISTIIFIFTGFWFDFSYGCIFFLPILIIANTKGIVYSLSKLKNYINPKLSKTIFAVSLIFSYMILPSLVTIPLNSDTNSSSDDVIITKDTIITYSYDTGIFLRYNSDETIMTTGVATSNKVFAFSGTKSHEVEMPSYFIKDNVQVTFFGEVVNASKRSIYELDFIPDRGFYYDVLLDNKTWEDLEVFPLIEYEFSGNQRYNFLSLSGKEEYIQTYQDQLIIVEFTSKIVDERYRIYDNGVTSVTFFTY